MMKIKSISLVAALTFISSSALASGGLWSDLNRQYDDISAHGMAAADKGERFEGTSFSQNASSVGNSGSGSSVGSSGGGSSVGSSGGGSSVGNSGGGSSIGNSGGGSSIGQG